VRRGPGGLPQTLAASQQIADNHRTRARQMFAGIQHQQQRAIAQGLLEFDVKGCARLLAQVKCARDGLGQEARIFEFSQFDQPDSVGHRLHPIACKTECQAARSGQCQQAHVHQQVAEVRDPATTGASDLKQSTRPQAVDTPWLPSPSAIVVSLKRP